MARVSVRSATRDDVPAIRRIARRSWRTAYGHFLDEETVATALEEWYDPENLHERLAARDVTVLVATRDDAVVGFCSGVGESGALDYVVELGALYVDPDEWRSGAGTALLGRFEDEHRRDGCEAIRAEVLADNDAGRSFYDDRGYEVVEEHELALFGESVRVLVLRNEFD